MDTMAFIVRGRSDTKKVYPRLEIRDLYNLNDSRLAKQWTLFVLSFLGLQYPDTPIPTTEITTRSSLPPGGDFFSIGAVHGMPYERWPGDPASDRIKFDKTDGTAPIKPQDVPPPAPHVHIQGTDSEGADDQPITPGDPNLRYGGYCNHGSILFPPWHRPYLLAIEQALGIVATNIAKEFGSRCPNEASEWAEAAVALRLPFWDWTLRPEDDKDYVPSLLLKEQVDVIAPDGKRLQVHNPTRSFSLKAYLSTERCRQFANVEMEIPFTDPPQYMMAYYRSWDRTVRWPEEKIEATDQPQLVEDYMRQKFDGNLAKVAHMFSFEPPSTVDKKEWPHQWDRFSNTEGQSDSQSELDAPSMNLESPHNMIHVVTGGVGHMGQNEYAGLDPIFYLHHANVDRLYALWEWVYPEYRPQYGFNSIKTNQLTHFLQPGGTFVQLPDSRLDQWTDMLPWRKKPDSYWTLDDVSWENREQWPNFYTYLPVAGVDLEKKTADEKERMEGRARLQAHFKLGTKENKDIGKTNPSPLFSFPSPDTISVPKHQTQLENYRHFVVAVELSEHLYNDSYLLELSYTAGKEVWYGHSAVLTRPIDSPCAGCQRRRAAGTKVKDIISIPVTHVDAMLKARPNQPESNEDREIFYLKQLIKGRLVGRNGQVYAHTVSPDSEVAKKDCLPVEVAPKLRLMTAYAGLSNKFDEANAPVEFFGWKDHADIFENTKWKKGPPPKEGPDASY